MTPFEFNHTLARLREHLHTAFTAAAALGLLAVAALVAHGFTRVIAPRMSSTVAVLAGAACGVALLVAWYVSMQRRDVYDAIVLARFRHVGGDAVRRHAAKLVDERCRRQLATAISRVVENADVGLPSAVPIDRLAVRGSRLQLSALAAGLRDPNREVQAHGMVLVRRLITNGARSPLYYHEGESDALERELDRINRELWAIEAEAVAEHEYTLAA